MRKHVVIIGLLMAGLCGIAVTAQQPAWKPPVGIPMPPWGLNEVAPAAPSPWTTARAGFYYVEESRAIATDNNNPYGTPALPRRSIPTVLPAGAVVEVHGTYTRVHTGGGNLRLNGTASSPVFIRGVSASSRPVIAASWEVSGTYFILENLEVALNAAGDKLVFLAPVQRGAMRSSEVHGNAAGGGVGVYSWSSDVVRDFVLFRNVIRDNGNWRIVGDQDIHGISVSPSVSNLWVLENELTRNSGDGIQLNAGNAQLQPTLHHVYIGRNVSHHNKQTGMWTKQAVDVIFSENLSYSHRPSDSSFGACMGFQYAPERVWFINNHIHDCEVGIGTGSDSGLGFGQNAFFIGNVIHNIHSPVFNSGSGWGQAAISLPGGVNRFVANNTIYDVDGGVYSPSGVGSFMIVNNIIANVTHAQGAHVFLEGTPAPSVSQFHHNLLGGTVRIKWGGSTTYNLATFLATFPGKGAATINADPMFVNAAGESFGLQPGSPAIDKGSNEAALYDAFKSYYGISLAIDSTGLNRPSGAGWEIGALEYPGLRPRAPTDLRIIR